MGMLLISPLPPPSIPAKAGISFSRQREFSAKRNIAMVACRRMRLRRRDSCLRRNGRGGGNGRGDIVGNGEYCRLSHPPPLAGGKNYFLSKKEFPFPRKRESPYPLIVKNDAVRALLAPANREIPAFAGMEGEGGNGRGGREWKRGAGMKKGAGMEEGSGNLLNPPPTFSNRRGIAFLSGGLKCGRIRRRLCRRRGGRGGRSRWRPRRHGCRRECPPAM